MKKTVYDRTYNRRIKKTTTRKNNKIISKAF